MGTQVKGGGSHRSEHSSLVSCSIGLRTIAKIARLISFIIGAENPNLRKS